MAPLSVSVAAGHPCSSPAALFAALATLLLYAAAAARGS
jgi:hypothetical protein